MEVICKLSIKIKKMKKNIYRQKTDSWYLERILFLIAGIFVLISATLEILGVKGSVYFAAFVGLVLIVFALSGYCPMAIILGKMGVKGKE